MVECVEYLDGMVEPARYFESAEAEQMRNMLIAFQPLGIYGRDRRGAHVVYYKMGKADPRSIVKESSEKLWQAFQSYMLLFMFDRLYQDSVHANMGLMAGWSWLTWRDSR